jgi:hypothetical protein
VFLIIDAIGNMSYLLPITGEGSDVVLPPFQAVALNAMYTKSTPYAGVWI